jgi:hypothetical protein
MFRVLVQFLCLGKWVLNTDFKQSNLLKLDLNLIQLLARHLESHKSYWSNGKKLLFILVPLASTGRAECVILLIGNSELLPLW